MDLKEIKIWNIKYNLLTPREIADIVERWISEGKRSIHLTGANLETVAMAQDQHLLRQAILDSDIVNVDSSLPAFFIKNKGYDIKGRAATPDVMEELIQKANNNGHKVFFLGSKQETLDKLKVVLDREYPSLKIVGLRNGYYEKDEEMAVINDINKAAPDYLFIAFPSPRKEEFILQNKSKINAGVLYGVGGALDAKAGVLKRPPKWLRGKGFEAFFRVVRQPKYLKRTPLLIKFLKIVSDDRSR